MKFSISDILAVSIGSAVIISFSYLYYRDISVKAEASSGKPIGTLTYKRNTAERKYSGQVVWDDIDNGIPVYDKDSIRTLEGSEAKIRLDDNTDIMLTENSMILLSQEKNGIDIDFEKGSIFANRDNVSGDLKKINIKSGNTKVSIDKSNIKLSQNKSGVMNVKVDKGNAEIDTGKSKDTLGQDKQANISGDNINNLDIGIKLSKPEPDMSLVTQTGKMKIDFSWDNVKGDKSFIFEIAKDNSFENIVNKSEVKKNAYSIELTGGIYYWRVSTGNKNAKKQELSETRRLSILVDDPLVLISPVNEQRIAYRNTLPMISFKWTKSDIASGYIFKLAGDPQMSKIIQRLDLSNNSFTTDSLRNGVYFWQVEKISALNNSAGNNNQASSINRFEIIEKEIIPPPELIYPNNAKQFSKRQVESKHITFTWKNNPDIREYKLILARDDKFDEILFTGTSKVNFLYYNKALATGKYYWKVVAAVDNETDVPSAERQFSVIESDKFDLIQPANNAIINPAEGQRLANIKFSWDKSEFDCRYKLQLSKDKDFAAIEKESVLPSGRNSMEIQDIAPGVYFWRVQLLDDNELVFSDSEKRSITIEEILNDPVVNFPKNGYTVDMKNKNDLTFEWKKIEGAVVYRFRLFQIRKDKDRLIADSEQPGTEYKITDLQKLDTGNFYWTVQAFDLGSKKEIKRKSSITKSSLTITLGSPMKKADVSTIKIENL